MAEIGINQFKILRGENLVARFKPRIMMFCYTAKLWVIWPVWHSARLIIGLNLSRYVNRNADAFMEKAARLLKMNRWNYKKFQSLLSGAGNLFVHATYTYATTDQVNGWGSRISHPADRFADVVGWYMKQRTWILTQPKWWNGKRSVQSVVGASLRVQIPLSAQFFLLYFY